jgi:hypothetical protein
MTPDELERVAKWISARGPWIAWYAICGGFILLALLLYVTADDAAYRAKQEITLYICCGLLPVPYTCRVLYRLNNRIAHFRLRKQDSLARLTKRHEKMLAKVRDLEHEVYERTEDLPPETIPVSMRDYSDRTFDY